MGNATHMGEMRNTKNILVGKLMERNHLRDLGTDGSKYNN
jgi:hypothetical protein